MDVSQPHERHPAARKRPTVELEADGLVGDLVGAADDPCLTAVGDEVEGTHLIDLGLAVCQLHLESPGGLVRERSTAGSPSTAVTVR